MPRYHNRNGIKVQYTAEEETARDAEEKAWNDAKADRKLAQIKEIRLQKLQETDYLSNSDVTMPSYIKTWRQSLRDIPQDNTTESKYDELLARNSDEKLTHSIWKQPTS